MGELAPRDVVARGVFEESQRTGRCYLDITHRPQKWLYARFPTIQAHVQERNLDLARDWLPVIPAAHYTCGGIATDLKGKTNVANLYAAGEAARTGLHGGNRLASTSLLEGLVFGASVAEEVGSNQGDVNDAARMIVENSWSSSGGGGGGGNAASSSSRKSETKVSQKNVDLATELLQSVRKCMWDHVGVIRTTSGLQTALEKLSFLSEQANELFSAKPCPQSAGVRDASVAGLAVARAALENKHSIGAHCIVVEDSDSDEDDVAAAAGMQ